MDGGVGRELLSTRLTCRRTSCVFESHWPLKPGFRTWQEDMRHASNEKVPKPIANLWDVLAWMWLGSR